MNLWAPLCTWPLRLSRSALPYFNFYFFLFFFALPFFSIVGCFVFYKYFSMSLLCARPQFFPFSPSLSHAPFWIHIDSDKTRKAMAGRQIYGRLGAWHMRWQPVHGLILTASNQWMRRPSSISSFILSAAIA